MAKIIRHIVGRNEKLTKLDPKLADRLIAIFRSVPPVRQPRFGSGVMVERPSFVTDVDGSAWWIDPTSQIITRAVNR